MKFEKLGAITKNLDSRRIPLNSEERIAKSKQGLYPYIGANNIVGYIDEYIFDEKILCVAEDGGSWGANQQCAVIYEGKTWVNNHAHVLTENAKASLEYIKNYLNYANLNKYIKGATRGKLNKSVLENIPIPYPPFPDQLHIASILSKAEILIAQRKESIRLLDEFLKSTFLEMFGDPVWNEKGWEMLPFSELVAKDCPLTYGIVQPGNEYPNGVPVIRPVDLTQTLVTRDGLKLIDPKISEQFKRTVLKGGELLMCVRGTTGVVSIASKELEGCNVTRGITPIWFSDDYNSLFAFGLFQTQAVKNRIQELTYGATLKQINLGDLRKIKLINPPIALQTQFAQIVEKTEALKSQYQQSLQELENLYGSLSQKAFRGELGVKQNNSVTV
jgi:type I restriction enzyme S subunit